MSSSKLDLYKFVKEPSDRLKCMVCYDLPQIPLQHEDCGKVFCKVCIDKNGVRPCPNCRGKNKNYFIDRRCAQEIAELPVQCSNMKRGCPWEGTMDTSKAHIRTCTFVPVYCPNKCDLPGKRLLLEHLDRHLKECPNRQHTCEHCGKSGTYASITGTHDRECPKKLVPCSQCGRLFERRMIPEHVGTSSSCEEFSHPKQSIKCKATEIGKETSQTGKRDRRELREIQEHRTALVHSRPPTVFVPDFSKLKRNKQRFLSLPFYVGGRYKMRLAVEPNGFDLASGTHVSVFIELLKEHHSSKSSSCATVTISLLNQVSPNHHHHEQSVSLVSPYCDTGRGVAAAAVKYFISHRQLTDNSDSRVRYLVGDRLLFHVTVTVQNVSQRALQAHKFAHMSPGFRDPQNEQFTFQVQNYSAEDKYVSEYSLKDRYNVFIQLFTKTDYLSLLVRVERKQDCLPDVFEGILQVELLNQLEDQNHHTKLLREAQRNPTTGTTILEEANFIHWTGLALSFGIHGNTWYLVNDTLFFRVTMSMEKQDKKLLKENQQDLKAWLECTAECWKC